MKVVQKQDMDGHWYWVPLERLLEFTNKVQLLEGLEYLEDPEGFDIFNVTFGAFATGGDKDLKPVYFEKREIEIITEHNHAVNNLKRIDSVENMSKPPSIKTGEEAVHERMQLLASRAVNKFGRATQVLKIGEEAAELAQAVLKKAVAEDIESFEVVSQLYLDLIGELADVTIMLEQAKVIFNQEIFTKILEQKLDKLEQRLERDEN